MVPCHTRPGSPKRLQHKGGALPKQFKTGFWCVAVATTPAARQLRRRSKRRQGYSLRGWGGVGREAWWEISFGSGTKAEGGGDRREGRKRLGEGAHA